MCFENQSRAIRLNILCVEVTRTICRKSNASNCYWLATHALTYSLVQPGQLPGFTMAPMPPGVDNEKIELSTAVNPMWIHNSKADCVTDVNLSGLEPNRTAEFHISGGDAPGGPQPPPTPSGENTGPSPSRSTDDASSSTDVKTGQPSAVAAVATESPPDTLHPSHHDEDDAASHSSSSVDSVTRRNTTGGEEEEDADDDDSTATEEVASPMAVTSPVMVDESSEQETTLEVDAATSSSRLSLGAAVMALGALTRLRVGVRRVHATLAKRLGIFLMVWSVIHDAALIKVGINEHGALYTHLTLALSISAFVLHVALELAHDDSLRVQCTAHFFLLVMDPFIRGAFDLAQRKLSSAAYYLVGWGLILYPLVAWGLHRLLRAAKQFDQATKIALSSSTVTVFASSAMPMLYFFCNGVLCIKFKGETHCVVRNAVNYAAILAILSNAVLFILLTLQPVSLTQIVRLDIPPAQLVVFGFHGILLGLALALHSQTENFGPITPAIEYLSAAPNPCFLFFVVAFVISVVNQTRVAVGSIEEGGGADHRMPAAATVTAASVGPTQQYGAMIPHRIVMVGFTVLYLVLEAAPVSNMVQRPFAPLSAAAAVFHIWMRAEDASSVRWSSVKLHYVAHTSSTVIIGIRYWRNGNLASALSMLIYLIVFYPGLYKAVTRFRSSVRAHSSASAAKLAGVSFVAFWSAVVPVMLYLGSDSLGTFLPVPSLSTAVVVGRCMLSRYCT